MVATLDPNIEEHSINQYGYCYEFTFNGKVQFGKVTVHPDKSITKLIYSQDSIVNAVSDIDGVDYARFLDDSSALRVFLKIPTKWRFIQPKIHNLLNSRTYVI